MAEAREEWVDVTVFGSRYEEHIEVYSGRRRHRLMTDVFGWQSGDWMEGSAP